MRPHQRCVATPIDDLDEYRRSPCFIVCKRQAEVRDVIRDCLALELHGRNMGSNNEDGVGQIRRRNHPGRAHHWCVQLVE